MEVCISMYTTMPYTRSRTYRKRTYRKRTSPNVAATKRLIRSELRKEDRKDHPLEWVDVIFDGNYISTSPNLLSFTEAVKNELEDKEAYKSWPQRDDGATGHQYSQANIYLTGVNWQLRYQQNEQASDVTVDTVRTVMYSFNDTYPQNSNTIFGNGDIDRPPNTVDVRSMFMDKIFTLKSQVTETTTDDTEFVPGFRILKGFKKLNHKFTQIHNYSLSASTVIDGGDVRLEQQSGDNSLIGEVELFGFVRIYYRVMA